MAPSRPDQVIYTISAMDIWARNEFPDTYAAFLAEYSDRAPSTLNIQAVRAQKSTLLDIGRESGKLFAYINFDEEIRFLRRKDPSEDIAVSLSFMSMDAGATSDDGELKALTEHDMEAVLQPDALADLFSVVFAADTYRKEARLLRAVVMYCLANDGVVPGFITTKEVQPEDFEKACMAVFKWHMVNGLEVEGAIWAPQDTEAERRRKAETKIMVEPVEVFKEGEEEDDVPIAEQEELAQLREEKLQWDEERADLQRQLTRERNATFDANQVVRQLEKDIKELRDERLDEDQEDDQGNRRYNNSAAEVESLKANLHEWQDYGDDMRARVHALEDELDKAKNIKADFKAEMEEMMRRHFGE